MIKKNNALYRPYFSSSYTGEQLIIAGDNGIGLYKVHVIVMFTYI
jgi:hypothetical protein